MGIDRIAQVGGDALAEPAHHVEAQRREHAERHADAEQREEVLAQRHHAGAGVGGDEALVDQRAQRQRQHQRADRGQDEEHAGQGDAPAVRAQERQQAAEGAHVAGGLRRSARAVGVRRVASRAAADGVADGSEGAEGGGRRTRHWHRESVEEVDWPFITGQKQP